MQLDPSQSHAADLGCTAPIAVVTGGPGTGKTTTLRQILDRLDAAGETYALASPTGKAAKRMSESTGREAVTLHRLLGIGKNGKRIDPGLVVDVGCVFVDEFSMADLELVDVLMQSVAKRTRVVFIGDADQLPSVGPGRVLADLVESNVIPVARLNVVHRAAAESWVCRNAPRVLAGQQLELAPLHDFRFMPAAEPADVARIVADVVASPEFRGPNGELAQVLTPQHNTDCGVQALNKLLQARINPRLGAAQAGQMFDAPEDWTIGEKTFRIGDRVLCTKNDYEQGIFNGETGVVLSITEKQMVVDFGGGVEGAYSKIDAANHLELAYAMTVHKSQGSEYPWVVMVAHSVHTFMLNKRLFYTGITRAKKGVVIVGNPKGLGVALGASEPPKRNTGLVERMQELSGVQVIEKKPEPEQRPRRAPAPPKPMVMDAAWGEQAGAGKDEMPF